jgi:hypothetical protein
MEGFETIRTPAAYITGLKDEGYTSKQRCGSHPSLLGLRVLHATIIRGYDLPPCVLAQWEGGDLPTSTYTARTFSDEAELDDWIKRWSIRLGPLRKLHAVDCR